MNDLEKLAFIGHYHPSIWFENFFTIEDRKHPLTAEDMGRGLILLGDHQKRIIDAALERKDGRFRWATIIYSCPKKSGKTRVAAGAASWLAWDSGEYSEVYCLANDGKQSADRVLGAIKKATELDKGGIMRRWNQTRTSVVLPNGAFIEAIPVDPTGEAGCQPTGSFWSELWGFRLNAKERLWTELTIPPTRFGHAIRWVESYAGYVGESPVLEQLYLQGVGKEEHPDGEGVRHPDFPDLPVYVNERAGIFCYWDHEPRMPWQTPEYYEMEAAVLHPDEFARIHRNEWIASVDNAIPIEQWDHCRAKLPPLGPSAQVVLGLDAAVSGDCTALVAVTKHPHRKDAVALRGVEVWAPPQGGKIDYSETIEPAVRRWCERYNVVCIVYDPYQLHKMATDLRKEGLAWFEEFSQGAKRGVADKQFYDLVMARKVAHDGNDTMRNHVQNAAAKKTSDTRSLRFVKKADKLPIDALVSASMACYQALYLNL